MQLRDIINVHLLYILLSPFSIVIMLLSPLTLSVAILSCFSLHILSNKILYLSKRRHYKIIIFLGTVSLILLNFLMALGILSVLIGEDYLILLKILLPLIMVSYFINLKLNYEILRIIIITSLISSLFYVAAINVDKLIIDEILIISPIFYTLIAYLITTIKGGIEPNDKRIVVIKQGITLVILFLIVMVILAIKYVLRDVLLNAVSYLYIPLIIGMAVIYFMITCFMLKIIKLYLLT